MRIIRIIIPMVIILAGCAKGGLTKQEKAVISGQGQVMRVLTVDNRKDSLFLRIEYHLEPYSVFYRSCRVEVFEFCKESDFVCPCL